MIHILTALFKKLRSIQHSNVINTFLCEIFFMYLIEAADLEILLNKINISDQMHYTIKRSKDNQLESFFLPDTPICLKIFDSKFLCYCKYK